MMPALILAFPLGVRAGMASFSIADLPRVLSLSNMTRQRLEAISFFVVVVLAGSWIVQRIWNSLRCDFPRLPRLSFARALGIVVLWGVAFLFVLLLITGARELLTPGAWVKSGSTFRLVDDPDPGEAVSRQLSARYAAMERLRTALFGTVDFAHRSLPERDAAEGLPPNLIDVPVYPGQTYRYVGGRIPDGDRGFEPIELILYEGDALGPDRLVLLSNGTIVWMPVAQIDEMLRSKRP